MLALGIVLIVYGVAHPKTTVEYVKSDTGEVISVSTSESSTPMPTNTYYRYDEADQSQLEAYQTVNADCVGIIRIDGTVLNHPFMQTPDDEQFYLHRDLNKKYNSHGIPFASAASTVEGTGNNLVIYGHNISLHTRDVFADLVYYEDVDYYKEHPYITTVTKGGTRTWVIWGAFLIDTSDENVFRYSDYTDFADEDTWNTWYQNIMARNLLDTDIHCEYGDTFILLSTCSLENAGSGTNRMCVVAKLISTEEDDSVLIEQATLSDNPQMPDAITGKNKTTLKSWEYVDSSTQ